MATQGLRKNVQIGVGLFPIEPPKEVAQFAKLADDLGYSRIYVGDSQLIWREAYITLAAIALNTSQATIGPGVSNPLTRDLTVIASALATLDELSGDRVFLGLGLGDSSVYTMGKRPSTVAQLERAIGVIRGLYSGMEATHDGAKVHLGYPREGKSLSILVAANGPRMLQMAGRCADGAILPAGLFPEYFDYYLRHIQEGAAAAGRDLKLDKFKFVLWVPCSIHQDGQAAKDAVRSHVARVVKQDLPVKLPRDDQHIIDRIRTEYDYYEHMTVGTKHAELVPNTLVEKFAIAGTVSECRSQLESALAYGPYINEVAIIPYAFDPDAKSRMIRSFAEEVVTALAVK